MFSLILYTDNLPANVAGRANAFLIRIRPKYRNDKGIHVHEELHVTQWWCGVLIGLLVAVALSFGSWAGYWPFALIIGAGLHPLAYGAIWQYRLMCEVACYRAQALHYADDRRLLFAQFIHIYYDLAKHINERAIYERLKA